MKQVQVYLLIFVPFCLDLVRWVNSIQSFSNCDNVFEVANIAETLC